MLTTSFAFHPDPDYQRVQTVPGFRTIQVLAQVLFLSCAMDFDGISTTSIWNSAAAVAGGTTTWERTSAKAQCIPNPVNSTLEPMNQQSRLLPAAVFDADMEHSDDDTWREWPTKFSSQHAP